MKRLILTVAFLTLLLTSCSSEGVVTESKITVLSPMTLSNNAIGDRTVKLRMIEGRYYEDWNPGAIMGTIWEGKFIFEVTDSNERVIKQTVLPEIHEGVGNQFTSIFDILFDDYNDDGDIDFIIGQYGSSNGNDYKIFTLRKGGRIEELKVKDKPYIFISERTGFYSVKLSKTGKGAFIKSHYDNTKGKNIKETYLWDENQFILTKSEEE